MTRPNLFKRRGTGSIRTNNAILLSARYAQTCKAMGLKRAFPGTELFLRQLVEAASFLDSNLAAKHRCDHGGFTAHHPPLGRRGWQALHSQRSDRQLTGKRMYREMRGSRGSTLALARSVGSRPIKTDSLIPAIIAPFHQLIPCARRNSRLFHEFLTILSGFVTNFSQKNRKTLLVGTGAARLDHKVESIDQNARLSASLS